MLVGDMVSLLLLWFAFTEDNPVTAYLLGLWSGPPDHSMTKFLLKEEIGILHHALRFALHSPQFMCFDQFLLSV